MNLIPWLISDAEIALWAAWKDGMPFRGPGAGRGNQEPLFIGHSSLTITETFEPAAATGHGWTGAAEPAGSSWQITAEFPDGALADDFGRVLGGMHAGGLRILTVRYLDEPSGEWTKLSFFYVTPATDAASESAQVIGRAVTLKSTWKQEETGSTDAPGLEPVLHGTIEWVCGALRIPAISYDPSTETWTTLSRNNAGGGTRYVTLTPITEDEGSDVALAYYLPRMEDVPVTGDELATARVLWQNTLAVIIGNESSTIHHGLVLRGGHVLQTSGIVEPLVMLPQDRVIDEPVVVFRFGRRVYATLGHGVLAVPRLTENEAPPVTLDPAFRLAIPGPANPATGQSGLTLLPNGAWLDGTVLIQP